MTSAVQCSAVYWPLPGATTPLPAPSPPFFDLRPNIPKTIEMFTSAEFCQVDGLLCETRIVRDFLIPLGGLLLLQ